MKIIIKILTLGLFLNSILLANDNLVINFEKKRVSTNQNVKLKDIKIFYKQELDLKNWNAYVLEINANIGDKSIKVKDILFSDGKIITTDLYDLKTTKSFKDIIAPTLTKKYYQKSKLVAGDEKAKNKIVVFSDPLCKSCKKYIPEIINFVNQNKEQIALYYYFFPPKHTNQASLTLSKLIHIAKSKNNNDILVKAYKINWAKHFEPTSNDEQVILEAFNKELGLDINIEELYKRAINTSIEKDIDMGENILVNSTPTIYINGKKDPTMEKYKSLAKKIKAK